MAVKSLDDVLARLKSQVGNDLALAPVCTRLMLRTGVNLRKPRPEQLLDGSLISKVVDALSAMGYAF